MRQNNARGFDCTVRQGFAKGAWLTCLFLACGAAWPAYSHAPGSTPKPALVKVQMHNMLYRFSDQVAVRIFDLQGELTPTREGSIVVFDDKTSFQMAVDAAQIALGTQDLTHALQQHAFSAPDSPLKQVVVTAVKDHLKIEGKLHSKGDVLFQTEGTLSTTPAGEIRLHAEKIKAAHLPVKGLMDLLGVKISDVLSTRKVRGIRVEGDDLLITPDVLPAPRIQGKITAARVAGDRILLTFGAGAAKIAPVRPGNYMAFRYSQFRFGKLTMDDTDMVLIDMDPKDPFDFFLDHYKEQLEAGYTKTTAQWGLRVFMKDYNKLRSAGAGGSRQ
jgi:hypothetical protein